MRIALVVLLLSSLAVAQSQPQRKPAAPPKAAPIETPAAAAPQADAQTPCGTAAPGCDCIASTVEGDCATSPARDAQAQQQRIEAARRDIQRMRNLVEQLDRNRAFASPGETPLNHEFELNIELWRTLLDHLDRELAPPAPPKAAPQS